MHKHREHGEHCTATPYTNLSQLARQSEKLKRGTLAVTISVSWYAGPSSASKAAPVSAVVEAAETQRSTLGE